MICFHNPEEENGYLSNWYLSGFTVDGIKFSSMEQYMMYEKALLFQDHETAGKILQTDDAAEIKALGKLEKTGEDNPTEIGVAEYLTFIVEMLLKVFVLCIEKN